MGLFDLAYHCTPCVHLSLFLHHGPTSHLPQTLVIQHSIQPKKDFQDPRWSISLLHQKKLGSLPKCGDTKKTLFGIKPARPRELSSMCKRKKHVTRRTEVCCAPLQSEAELYVLS